MAFSKAATRRRAVYFLIPLLSTSWLNSTQLLPHNVYKSRAVLLEVVLEQAVISVWRRQVVSDVHAHNVAESDVLVGRRLLWRSTEVGLVDAMPTPLISVTADKSAPYSFVSHSPRGCGMVQHATCRTELHFLSSHRSSPTATRQKSFVLSTHQEGERATPYRSAD